MTERKFIQGDKVIIIRNPWMDRNWSRYTRLIGKTMKVDSGTNHDGGVPVYTLNGNKHGINFCENCLMLEDMTSEESFIDLLRSMED